MSDDQPTSRRPIAETFGRSARGAVELCVRRCIHPDVVSYASVVAAGVAHSGLGAAPSGYRAEVAALLTAYVGTLGQAVSGRREFGGEATRP